jgi:fatty-acyl-CoA synthase
MAGSPCPIETMKRVIAEMHLSEITIAYGMTETSPVSFQSSTTTRWSAACPPWAASSPMLEAKVVDADGRTVPGGREPASCWCAATR